MNKYLPNNTNTIREFIYNGHKIDIVINFEESKEKIPLLTHVEKTVDNQTNFTWYHLIIKVNVPSGGSVKAPLNHPHNPLGITTFDNMKIVAETYLEDLIPKIIKKNEDAIKQYLTTL